jgi:hypothetical protein
VRGGGRLDADRIRVEDVDELGVDVRDAGSSARLSDAIVRRIDEVTDADDLRGRGVRAGAGASVDLERAIVDEAQSHGLSAAGGVLRLAHVVVRRTKPRLDLKSGLGMEVHSGGGAAGTSLVLEDNRTIGVFVHLAGSATITDTLIRRMSERVFDSEDGEGIVAREGSSIVAERVLIAEVVDRGVWIKDAETRAILSDVAIRDVAMEVAEQELGIGIHVELGASVAIDRASVDRVHSAGVYVSGGGLLEARDVAIRDVEVSPADLMRAHGLRVNDALARVERLRAERTVGAGASFVMCTGPNVLSDVSVFDTLEAPGDPEGSSFGGIWVNSGRLEVARAKVEASAFHGIRVVGGAVAEMQDVIVDGSRIAGLRIADQASAELARIDIADTRGDNLIVDDLSTVMMTDAVIRGSKSTGGGVGSGVEVTDSASLSIERFILGDNDAFGAQVAVDGQLDLADGDVFGSQIGVLLVTEGYDLGRVTDRVAYRDNQTAISRGQ